MTAEQAREISQNNGIDTEEVIKEINNNILIEAKKGYSTYDYYGTVNPTIKQHFENQGFKVSDEGWDELYIKISWW